MSSTHVAGKCSFLSKRFNNSKKVIGKDVKENVWLVLSLYKSARWLIRQWLWSFRRSFYKFKERLFRDLAFAFQVEDCKPKLLPLLIVLVHKGLDSLVVVFRFDSCRIVTEVVFREKPRNNISNCLLIRPRQKSRQSLFFLNPSIRVDLSKLSLQFRSHVIESERA